MVENVLSRFERKSCSTQYQDPIPAFLKKVAKKGKNTPRKHKELSRLFRGEILSRFEAIRKECIV